MVNVLSACSSFDDPFGIFQFFMKQNRQMFSGEATQFDPNLWPLYCLHVLLRFIPSDYPFGIFQLFLKENEQMLSSDATKFDPTWTQIHGTRVEHANNYTTVVVNISGFYANTRHNIIN